MQRYGRQFDISLAVRPIDPKYLTDFNNQIAIRTMTRIIGIDGRLEDMITSYGLASALVV